MRHDLIDRLLDIIEFLLAELFSRAASDLNLTIEGNAMSLNIGQTATARIAPTAAGAPSTVTNVVYDVLPAGAYTIVPSGDGLSAVYTAAVAGTGIEATVRATNSAGTILTDAKPLPDVVGVVLPPPADALNLSVTTP